MKGIDDCSERAQFTGKAADGQGRTGLYKQRGWSDTPGAARLVQRQRGVPEELLFFIHFASIWKLEYML